MLGSPSPQPSSSTRRPSTSRRRTTRASSSPLGHSSAQYGRNSSCSNASSLMSASACRGRRIDSVRPPTSTVSSTRLSGSTSGQGWQDPDRKEPTAVATATDVKQAGERAARSPWARGLARWGLVSRGILYGLVGFLAIRVAVVGSGRAPDRDTALKTLAEQPAGRLLLGLIAIGFLGYCLWRIAQALLGGGLEDTEDEGFFKRVSHFVRGVIFGAIFVSTVLLLIGSGGGEHNKEDRVTGFLLDLPEGPFIVGGIGVGFLIGGAWNFYRVLSQKFREKLKLQKMSDVEDKAFSVVGTVGIVARGVVFTLVGVFLIRAAYQYDPKEAVGLDGALSEVAQAPYGPFLLGVVAAGLFAFGLYSLAEARYREV